MMILQKAYKIFIKRIVYIYTFQSQIILTFDTNFDGLSSFPNLIYIFFGLIFYAKKWSLLLVCAAFSKLLITCHSIYLPNILSQTYFFLQIKLQSRLRPGELLDDKVKYHLAMVLFPFSFIYFLWFQECEFCWKRCA